VHSVLLKGRYKKLDVRKRHSIFKWKMSHFSQCRINHGAGGAHAPGPLSSGASKFFKVIIFIHMKYTKNQKWRQIAHYFDSLRVYICLTVLLDGFWGHDYSLNLNLRCRNWCCRMILAQPSRIPTFFFVIIWL